MRSSRIDEISWPLRHTPQASRRILAPEEGGPVVRGPRTTAARAMTTNEGTTNAILAAPARPCFLLPQAQQTILWSANERPDRAGRAGPASHHSVSHRADRGNGNLP